MPRGTGSSLTSAISQVETPVGDGLPSDVARWRLGKVPVRDGEVLCSPWRVICDYVDDLRRHEGLYRLELVLSIQPTSNHHSPIEVL